MGERRERMGEKRENEIERREREREREREKEREKERMGYIFINLGVFHSNLIFSLARIILLSC